MEWSNVITTIVTAVFTGGGVAAVAKYLLDNQAARHKNQRENRADELDVLYKHIEEQRSDLDAMRIELGKARDDCQACMMKYAVMEQQLTELKDRLRGDTK